MTGNYGSEILRGNIAFKPHALYEELFEPPLGDFVKEAAATYAEETRCHPVSFIAFKQVPWHHHSRLALEKSQIIVRAPYLDNELTALVYQAERSAILSKGPSFRLIADGATDLNRIPTDRGLDWPPMPIVTRMRNLYKEFTFRSEYAYDYGMPQWLAKVDHLLAPFHLERLFLGRHKFYHFRVWYRDRLSEYIKDVLLDERSLCRPYLRRKSVEQVVSQHVRGERNFTSEIHKLLTLELLHRKLIELR
jgi:asparagine synthase (glutamine-hydrolysing)